MAYEVNADGARIKVRSPLGVFLLTLITLGIYAIVWYYKINRELRDFGRARDNVLLARTDPAISVLAVTLGALLIVPAIVSMYQTVGRIRLAQRIGGAELTSGWLILILYLVPFGALLIDPYAQSGLNSLWRRYPKLGPGAELRLEEPPPPPPPGHQISPSRSGYPAPPLPSPHQPPGQASPRPASGTARTLAEVWSGGARASQAPPTPPGRSPPGRKPCPSCGQPLRVGATLCMSCGHRLDDAPAGG